MKMANQNDGIERLARGAAAVAMRAAVAYAREQGADMTGKEDALVEALKRHVTAAVDPALTDARAALECGMAWAAQATFSASMAVAGIAAAKEVLS